MSLIVDSSVWIDSFNPKIAGVFMPTIRPSHESLTGKLELYSLIDEGLDQVKQGKIKPMKESIQCIRSKLKQ